MIRLCVFDLDGTLCDTIHDVAKSINYGLAQYDLPPHPASDYIQYLSAGSLVRCAIGEVRYTRELLEKVRDAYMAYYGEHMADTTQPFPGIAELVAALNRKGITCGVLTNKRDTNAKKLIGSVFKKGSFRFVVGNSKLYPAKPDPTSLNVLLSAYNVTNEECLFIGDSGIDMKTAKSADVKCVGVSWGYERESMQEAAPDFIAGSADELLRIIDNQE